jgi:glycerate kinase
MARALGSRFVASEHPPSHGYGTAGEQELQNPSDLAKLARIVPNEAAGHLTALSRQVGEAVHGAFPKVIAAADVRNPLLGERGATRTFGSQKSGTPEQLEILERALTRLAEVVRRDFGFDFQETPGAGAAGGLGFGLMSFCRATIRPGFDVVAELVALKRAIEQADIVITGEGRLDEQTLEGKAPAGVARLARQAGKRVFAVVGGSSESPEVRNLFEAVFVLARDPITPQESIVRARELLQERARELAQMM